MFSEIKTRTGFAGTLAAGTALGVGELLAGLFRAVPSPLAAIGGVVIDSAPPFFKDFAISVFGTADKTALAIGTTVIALVVGWFMGIAATRRPIIGPLVLGGFGFLGLLASLGEPFAEPIQVVAASVVSVAAGWFMLRLMLGVAGDESGDAGADDSARRRFIRLAAVGSVGAAVAGFGGRRLLSRVPEVSPTDAFASASAEATLPAGTSLSVPGLTPVVVPNEDFYRIDTALVVPIVDERDWTLRVHGRVDTEVSFTYGDLLAMDLVEDYVTIACVSNEVGGGLVGNALWSGVRLTEILDEAGADRDGTQLVGRSVDGFTVGFPTEVAFDGRNPLVALAMNGEPLPRPHGYPARLIVPGLYGYVSATKWLSEIEITGWDDFDAYWVPRGWAKEAPVKTQSRIDVPTDGAPLTAGPVPVAGVAWAPLRGIEAVQVRADGGDWIDAELSVPLSDRSWVQWSAVIDLASGTHRLEVRATDGTGATQGERRVPARPDGAEGYHTIGVQVA